MQTVNESGVDSYGTAGNENLRETYVAEGLFVGGEIQVHSWEVDGTVVAGICPKDSPLQLKSDDTAGPGSKVMLHRETGIINLGGEGAVEANGQSYVLKRGDTLYLGKSVEEASFSSVAGDSKFYVLSYPADKDHPIALCEKAKADPLALGSKEECNERVIYKTIHPDGIQSCQLMMGYTELKPGSVWNTMPCHTHLKRSEVYCYFDLAEDSRVFHFMGKPSATRNLVMANEQVVCSPRWSIHCGCGTSSYSFVWGMGGENQDFTDMQVVPMAELK